MTSSSAADDDDFLAAVTAFATKEIEPLAEPIDREARLPAGITDRLAALDLLTIGVPTSLGGSGAGVHTALGCLAVLGSTSAAIALLAAGAHAAAAGVGPAASAAGQAVIGQPVAIIDGTSVAATGEGGRPRLSGTAARVEHAAFADLLVVVTGPPRDERVYLTSRHDRGVSLGPPLPTTGLRGADARPVILDSVPAEALGGPADAASLRRWQSMGLAAVTAGVARRALTEAELYAVDRVQFGQPIGDFPAVRAIFDSCEDLVTAAESELGAAGTAEAAGTAQLPRLARAARRTARGAVAVCLDAIQVHGGYGYVVGSPVERLLRDAISLRALCSQVFLRASASESRHLTIGLLPDLTR